MSKTGTKVCGICQCTFESGNCIHVSGQGTTNDPFIFTPVISDDVDNLVEEGPAGLGAFLPPVYLDPPAVHVYSTLAQVIAWDAAQIVFFDDYRYDTDSMHDTEQETSRLTFNTPGVYEVTFNMRWKKTNDSTATGDQAAFIRKNGSQILSIDSYPVSLGDSFAKHSLSYQGPFEAGDYVEALAKQDVVIDEEKLGLSVTVERMSPIFTAMYLRPIRGMSILGIINS